MSEILLRSVMCVYNAWISIYYLDTASDLLSLPPALHLSLSLSLSFSNSYFLVDVGVSVGGGAEGGTAGRGGVATSCLGVAKVFRG